MTRLPRPLFFRERERAAWLLVVACIAAGLWAVAQVLSWPIGARATVAAVAAAVALTVPELRARRATAGRHDRLVSRVEAGGHGGQLPRVRDVTDQRLRIHASSLEVPYIVRDKQGEVDAALSARRPVLIVGHSMAGKTRLAASCVRAAFPDAAFLAPLPGTALRELVESHLNLANTIVWLDDLDRFLTGESWLDPGLLEATVRGGAAVIGTIRRNALTVYRPRNEVRPAQWETICRFKRVDLDRRLSANELRAATEQVKDLAVRGAIQRYGLAEYLGAGPDAVDRFDHGGTECPVGAALVRAAIDLRRAGLVRLVRLADLRAALPIYLQDRPDLSIDDTAVTAGLGWATEKVNETVSLLLPNYHASRERATRRDIDNLDPLFEAFDYLVDVVVGRTHSRDRVQRDPAAVPLDMWRLVADLADAASPAERRDVRIAAGREFMFIDRERELTTLASWLASPPGSSPPLFVLSEHEAMVETALFRRLQALADPKIRDLVTDPVGRRLNFPPPDLVLSAWQHTGIELLTAMCTGAGQAPVLAETVEESSVQASLISALSGRHRPLIVFIDDLDSAIAPHDVIRTLVRLAEAARDLPLHILVGTCRQPQFREFFESEEMRATVCSMPASTMFDMKQVVRDYLISSGTVPFDDDKLEWLNSLLRVYSLTHGDHEQLVEALRDAAAEQANCDPNLGTLSIEDRSSESATEDDDDSQSGHDKRGVAEPPLGAKPSDAPDPP